MLASGIGAGERRGTRGEEKNGENEQALFLHKVGLLSGR